MNGHQRFLCQILCLGRGSADARKPPFIVGAQVSTEPAKKDTVICRISTEARPHQAPKLGFVRYHLLILVVRTRTGFGYKIFAFDASAQPAPFVLAPCAPSPTIKRFKRYPESPAVN